MNTYSSPRRRRLTITTLLVLTALLTAVPTLAMRQTRAAVGQTPTPQLAAAQNHAALPLNWYPQLTASAAIAVDITSGQELYWHNADTAGLPASTSKIITAMVTRSLLAPDLQVTIEEQDLRDPTIWAVAGLQAGDVVTVHDLLAGLMLPSGADACLALARVGGRTLDPGTSDPVGRFVEEMNRWATAHGLTNSRFTNPVGDDDGIGHMMSARDLAVATGILLEDPLLTEFAGTAYFKYQVGGPQAREIELYNTNQMLGDPSWFGVKTGYDEAALQTYVGGYWRGDHRIVLVILGSADRYGDTAAIVEAIDSTYFWMMIGQGTLSDGASEAIAAQGLEFRIQQTVLMTQEQYANVTWELLRDVPDRPWCAGIVVFSVGNREFARLPVYSIQN